jgi:acyl-CoA hydrolase
MTAPTPSSTRCEMTWIVMPGQANALGTVFGGQVAAWIDVCAAVSAQRFCRHQVVTAAMDSLIFRQPILQGQVVVLQAQVNWAGRTSIEVGVRVESEDPMTGERRHTSTAYLTFVALDQARNRIQVPTLTRVTDEDQRRWVDACARRDVRLAARKRDRERHTL